MAKKYIAVRNGHVNNVVFVCTGMNRCYWFDHVWPLIEGTSHQDFKGFDSLPDAKAYVGPGVAVAWRPDAEDMLIGMRQMQTV